MSPFTRMFHRILQATVGTLLIGTLLHAESPAAVRPVKPSVNITELLNVAGKQRMLSQRIAKDYLYINKKIAVDKATRQLKESLDAFRKNQDYLQDVINDPEIKNLIAFVNMSREELETTAQKPFSLDNAQLILDLSESMLEGSQYIVDSLKELVKHKDSAIVATAGKQRMLAQRIAKYYIAYQSGIKDKNTVDQMNKTVQEFNKNNKKLMEFPKNTPEITAGLKKIDSLWKIVYKFYLNIEKGGLPFIVFTSTDDITNKMDRITQLYVQANL